MAAIAVKQATSKAGWLLDKLADDAYAAASKELSLLLGVREEFRFIKDELEMMNAFLREAEEKQYSGEAAKTWVRQVRELAYAVEDCIDDFSLHLGRNGDVRRRNFVSDLRHYARSLRSLGARHRIAAQVQSLKSRVEVVSDRRKRYGITDVSKSSDEDSVARYDPRIAALFAEDSQMVGIEEPRKKLVDLLLDDTEPQRRLIAVVGTGGLGKTTVVRKAYESPEVRTGRFTCSLWITVSQVYYLEGLLRDMIIQAFDSPLTNVEYQMTRDQLIAKIGEMTRDQLIEKIGKMTREQLIEKIKEVTREQLIAKIKEMTREQLIAKIRDDLQNKRYVIVFDDIWSIDAWKSLEPALPKNQLGSSVLLTTRNHKLAESCCTQSFDHIFPHEKLSPQQSMELFCRRVFNNSENTCPEDLREPTEAILKKCDGLPLAIISVAGVLASKPKKAKHEWGDMLSRLGSELDFNPDFGGMKHILTFSYNDLPYHVKRCFLYLSKFPEDYVISRKRVQRLWVAEGFATARHDMTAEEVSESYFNEIANRLLILPSDFSLTGKVKSFTIHDIMLELMVSKSREENFVSLFGKNRDWMPQDVIRRLSIHTERDLEKLSLSHVRSLSMLGDRTPDLISLSSMGMLQVLDFEGCDVLDNNHLKIIVKLLHLKYLSLRGTRVSELPKSLGNLQNLETLEFRNTEIRRVPAGIIKLQRLRFLRGGWYWDVGVRFPRGIGSLRALQELSPLSVVFSSKDAIKELAKLTQLRKLGVGCHSQERGKDLCNALKAMSNSLRSIHIFSPSSLMYLHNIQESPPLLLENLSLSGAVKRLPSWISSLRNVAKMQLAFSELEQDAIQELGTLPNLIYLRMHYGYTGETLTFATEGFPSLKVLDLSGVFVSSMSFQEGALPRLELLKMDSCYHMETRRISISGIENLSVLRKFDIREVHEDDVEAITAQVYKHPNHPNLAATKRFRFE